MNPVRALRERAAVTQTALAQAAGTSQPTIAAYEAGRKSPTVETLGRLAHAVGLEAHVQFEPPLTREDRRSLALHRAIARRLTDEPRHVLALARRNLATMQRRHGASVSLLREWRAILDRPVQAIVTLLEDTDPWARELRHVTPFAGVLSANDRRQVYERFAREERARAAERA
jgi:transcriptional regulator with XRE-family HTH domain